MIHPTAGGGSAMRSLKRAGDSVVHLVVRYSDRFVRGIGDTVAEHRRVLEAHGCVWVGKIGRGSSRG